MPILYIIKTNHYVILFMLENIHRLMTRTAECIVTMSVMSITTQHLNQMAISKSTFREF